MKYLTVKAALCTTMFQVLRKLKFKDEGRLRELGLQLWNEHFLCHIKSTDKGSPPIQDKNILFDALI